MKAKKKGSALIMTLALTIFIMGILGALFTLTINTINQINAYNKINSTYYASESGAQRVAINMLKDYKFNFNESLADNSRNYVRGELNTRLANYRKDIKDKIDNLNKSPKGDNTTLINDPSSISYYEIKEMYFNNDINCSSDNFQKITLEDNSSTWTYTVPIVLVCRGGIRSGNKDTSKEQKYSFKLILTIYEADGHNKDNTPYYFFKTSDSPEIKLK